MSKFKNKKQGDLPAVNTASLPDIVFMLLFFFMVATVMRDDTLMIENSLPSANQVEKFQKDRTMFIYAGKPKKDKYGTEARIQINDALVKIDDIEPSVYEALSKINEDLKKYFIVALKIDKDTNAGIVSDIKQELRKANALKVMYITNKKQDQ